MSILSCKKMNYSRITAEFVVKAVFLCRPLPELLCCCRWLARAKSTELGNGRVAMPCLMRSLCAPLVGSRFMHSILDLPSKVGSMILLGLSGNVRANQGVLEPDADKVVRSTVQAMLAGRGREVLVALGQALQYRVQ